MKLLSASFYELTDPFNIFNSVEAINTINDIKPGTCLILWGGEDIATEIYGEKPNRLVYAEKKSSRDEREIAYIHQAIKHDVPIIGICRGAQLMCAVDGGKLAQHIDGHGKHHMVTLHDEEDVEIRTNSSHHQMMMPRAGNKILATSNGTTGIDANNQAIKHERVNEVVYFPVLNGIGIQGHPEWNNCPQEFVDYCTRKIKEYLL
jgi:gamma-glutamyl-gamma-aminobutyrate hydrolase PuuD